METVRLRRLSLRKMVSGGSKFVYSMRFVGDVVQVESELENAAYLWGDQ